LYIYAFFASILIWLVAAILLTYPKISSQIPAILLSVSKLIINFQLKNIYRRESQYRERTNQYSPAHYQQMALQIRCDHLSSLLTHKLRDASSNIMAENNL
jgi:hypothetical protein